MVKDKAEKKVKAPKVVKPDGPMPEIRDKDGELKTLKRNQFPKSAAGKMAYCDYQLARWTEKKDAIGKQVDPLKRKKAKKERLQKLLKQLEEELALEEKAAKG
jgi:hypothetical protein